MEKQRQQIEELSAILEKNSFTPVAARVVLYLVIKPDNEATFEELNNYFKVSKSAISNALKILETSEMVISKTKLGGRKRYFSASLKKMTSIESMLEHHNTMKSMMHRILKIRNSKTQIDNEMNLIVSFLDMMDEELPALFEKYKRKHL